MAKKQKHYKAAEGKVFQRISDGEVFGNEIWLGICYNLNGQPCEPFEEKIEDYREIDDNGNDERI